MTGGLEATGFIAPLQAVSVEPLSASAFSAAGGAASLAGVPGASFGDWVARELAATNGKLAQANQGIARLASGDTSNLHQVMLGIEDARLSFQLMLQVRNRLLEAYQDVLRLQV